MRVVTVDFLAEELDQFANRPNPAVPGTLRDKAAPHP
jgi:hypothetical protein